MKNTVSTFKEQKVKGDKITMLTAYDYSTAKLMDQSGINGILVGDSLGMVMLGYENTLPVTMEDMIHHTRAVTRGAKDALVVGDMPFMSYQVSVEEAMYNAGRLMKEGRCQAVKLEGGASVCPQIKAITAASIPVMAHIGLTPQSVNVFGGFKVQGKSEEGAKKLIEEAKAVEEAGAFAIVLECVPAKLAEIISESINIPTIGIGAGSGCDGQILVYQDMLGMVSDFTPKFVKQFAKVGDVMKEAFAAYIEETKQGSFPAQVILGDRTMKIVKTVDEVRVIVKEWKKEGLTVGLVPTMGFLHEGHKSLITRAVSENDRVVVSDFVNPTQFGVGEDLESYPRDLERDTMLCEEAGANLIFNPEPENMYFDDFSTYVNIESLSEELCGKSRPIHFRGVGTVVSKLFNIVNPDRAYFGQKDAQQLAIIKRMVRDLNFDIEIVGCPIVREEDGLAKSSRNTYLSKDERKAALILSKAVKLGEDMAKAGEKDTDKIVSEMIKLIETEPMAKIDYVQAVDAVSVKPVKEMTAPVLVAMAVYIGKTRLIDNFIYEG